MDIILLPVLNRATSPDQALKVMKESRRSVTVVVGSSPQGLLTSLEVRRAKNQKQPNLQETKLEAPSIVFEGDFTTTSYIELGLPENLFPMVQQHLMQTFPGMAHRQLNVPAVDLPKFELCSRFSQPTGPCWLRFTTRFATGS
jgi:CBS domain-containing protein